MSSNKRKAEVVDLSDDRDEAVFDFIKQCTEISTLKSVIVSATKRLSSIGLGVVMESSNYYSNKVNVNNEVTVGEYFVGNFLIGSLQKQMQIEICVAKSKGNGCSAQLKCMWEIESKDVPLFTYQFQNEQYNGHAFFPFQGCNNNEDDDEFEAEDQVYMVDDENISRFITSCQLQNIAPSRYQATLNGFTTDIKLKCVFADIIVDAMKALSTKFHFRVKDYFSKSQCRLAFDDEIFWEYLFPSDSSSDEDDGEDKSHGNDDDEDVEDENEMNGNREVEIDEDEQEDIGDEEDGDDDDDEKDGMKNPSTMPISRRNTENNDNEEDNHDDDPEIDQEEEEEEELLVAHADDDEDINEDSEEEEQAKQTIEAVLDSTGDDIVNDTI